MRGLWRNKNLCHSDSERSEGEESLSVGILRYAQNDNTHRFCKSSIKNHKGAVLPITLAFVLAFTLVGFSTIYMSTLQNEAAEKSIASEKAFWLAEAGIQRALWEVKEKGCLNIPFSSSGKKILLSEDIELDENFDKKGLYKGLYDVSMTNACSKVISTGIFRVKRVIEFGSQSEFTHAIFADKKITIHNETIIDSYDSRRGKYGEDLDGDNKNIFSNGDVGSNQGVPLTSGDSAISLMNNPFINGDISTGPGGKISVSSGHQIDDYMNTLINTVTNENKRELPSVVVPSHLTDMKEASKLVVTDSYTLKENKVETDEVKRKRRYKFPSIEVKNGGKLYIDGDIEIYLTKTNLDAFNALKVEGNESQIIIKKDSSLKIYTDGNITIENGANMNAISSFDNQNLDPKTLTIYSTVKSDKVTDGVDIKNGSDFYGAVYAPGTHISITNNGNIYGAFVGKSFYVPNSVKLHYDESLAGKITDSAVIWREIGTNVVP